MLKCYVKVFYVMSKALKGELSCPTIGLVYHPSPKCMQRYMKAISIVKSKLDKHTRLETCFDVNSMETFIDKETDDLIDDPVHQ